MEKKYNRLLRGYYEHLPPAIEEISKFGMAIKEYKIPHLPKQQLLEWLHTINRDEHIPFIARAIEWAQGTLQKMDEIENPNDNTYKPTWHGGSRRRSRNNRRRTRRK